MLLVLDTCAILWSVSDPDSLSPHARQVLSRKDTQVHISPISCAEIACGVARGRIVLDRHWKLWFRHFIELNRWLVADIDLNVIEEAYSLPEPFHRDPADRIIVATARRLSCPVLTQDRKILDYPHVDAVW